MLRKTLSPEEQRIQVNAEILKVQTMYKDSPTNKKFNGLILGESGSGKTWLTRTARKPIHVDSFDPGGTRNLVDLIDKKQIVADTRFEAEDPKDPSVFNLWIRETKKRIEMGYFNRFGTYVLDSATTWSDAIMNKVLGDAGLAGKAPRFTHDYVPQKVLIRNWLRVLQSLPCDFLFMGHLEGFKDEVSGKITYRFMTTGKGSVSIPLLFDEIWVMDPKKTAEGIKYRILTQSTGTHLARSRLAKGGLLNTYEKPNLKNILKKAKFFHEDKENLTNLGITQEGN